MFKEEKEDTLYITDDDYLDIYESMLLIMEDVLETNVKLISEPDFEELFRSFVLEDINSYFSLYDIDDEYFENIEEEIDDIVEEIYVFASEHFFQYICPIRSHKTSIIVSSKDTDTDRDIAYISAQIAALRAMPQPAQRTPEWYEFRYNLITASNAYKAFENQTIKNQLIYEKCCAKKEASSTSSQVNINSTLHWGQKYEPLSVMIYEYLYNTKVEDFGCIKHGTYSCLGASPDGINVDPSSPRYGRMLEIKNIVNREINGIPKKEYWIQTQLQMEVCDLPECDFLETRFLEISEEEYKSKQSVKSKQSDNLKTDNTINENNLKTDNTTNENNLKTNNIANENNLKTDNITNENNLKTDNTINENNLKTDNTTNENNLKTDNTINENNLETEFVGSIIYFQRRDGTPFYVYKDIRMTDKEETERWEEGMLDKYLQAPYNYTYISYIYWKLADISCVLIERNRKWFNANIGELCQVWKTIEEDRKNGYTHREPNRRPVKESINITNNIVVTKLNVSLIDFVKGK